MVTPCLSSFLISLTGRSLSSQVVAATAITMFQTADADASTSSAPASAFGEQVDAVTAVGFASLQFDGPSPPPPALPPRSSPTAAHLTPPPSSIDAGQQPSPPSPLTAEAPGGGSNAGDDTASMLTIAALASIGAAMFALMLCCVCYCVWCRSSRDSTAAKMTSPLPPLHPALSRATSSRNSSGRYNERVSRDSLMRSKCDPDELSHSREDSAREGEEPSGSQGPRRNGRGSRGARRTSGVTLQMTEIVPPPPPPVPPPPPPAVPLPNGWIEYTEPSGAMYFYNERTGQSTWNRPVHEPLAQMAHGLGNALGDVYQDEHL